MMRRFAKLSVPASIVLPALCLAGITAASAQVVSAPISAGGIVSAIAANPITNKVYVATTNGSDPSKPQPVTVIDGATHAATQIAGAGPAGTLAVNTITNKIYSADSSSPIVQIIDGSSSAVTSFQLSATGTISQLFVDSSRNTLYATGTDASGPEVFVVNGATNAVTSTIPIPIAISKFVSVSPYAYGPVNSPFAIDLVHNKLYAINGIDASLYMIDLAGGTVTRVQGAGPDSHSEALVVDTSRNQIYVLNGQNSEINTGTVAVFDGATGTLKTNRPVGQSPISLAINPVTHAVFIANAAVFNQQTGLPISGASLTVLDGNNLYPYTIDLTDATNDDNFSPDIITVDSVANKIYVGDSDGGYMLVMDGNILQPASIWLSGFSGYAAINETTHALYFELNDNQIAVVDGTGGSTAVASIFPNILTFSAEFPNTSSPPQTIYLANIGGQPMTVTNLALESPYPSSIVQTNNCTNPLAPGEVCPINLVFSPTAGNQGSGGGYENYDVTVETPGTNWSIFLMTSIEYPYGTAP